ncbi:hypothetical protein ACFQE5_01740 [Pseudonocardia hispaniensis]|uniref:Uncharacterized protein n=1 Tax=Pseudonocardia hispaniensis TaxID=904933 RepID=A0ABW1IWV8_9PSEU
MTPTDRLSPEQQERAAALDTAHRIAVGNENITAADLIDMACYIVTGRRPPQPDYSFATPLPISLVEHSIDPEAGEKP